MDTVLVDFLKQLQVRYQYRSFNSITPLVCTVCGARKGQKCQSNCLWRKIKEYLDGRKE